MDQEACDHGLIWQYGPASVAPPVGFFLLTVADGNQVAFWNAPQEMSRYFCNDTQT